MSEEQEPEDWGDEVEQGAPAAKMAVASRARATPIRGDTVRRVRKVWPAILEVVEKGATPIVAAGAAGVPSRTFLRWRSMMDAGDPQLAPFFEKLDMAIARAEVKMLEIIQNPPVDNHGRSDYARVKGAMFVLERSRRERWGPKLEIDARYTTDMIESQLLELEKRMPAAAFEALIEALAGDQEEDDDDE